MGASHKTEEMGGGEAAHYYELVEEIVQGQYEHVASRLSHMRSQDPSPSQELSRRLIAARLAMKTGGSIDDKNWINLPAPDGSWLLAEKYFVLGLLEYRLERFKSGRKYFTEAETIFRALGMHAREFLSSFNAAIGSISSGDMAAPGEQLHLLRSLELRVAAHSKEPGCPRVIALIHRQRSHAFEEKGRLHASLEEIFRSIQIFELHGPSSDYHLALLHAADICLDLGDPTKARALFERVLGHIDSRVEFPHAFIKWRLGGDIPDPDSFSAAPHGWKQKFRSLVDKGSEKQPHHGFWEWDTRTGRLFGTNGGSFLIKPSSLEGRLIRLLVKNRASKSLLIESLWPEKADAELLDNRLHRLISRLNKKLDGAIEFDGKHYKLLALIAEQRSNSTR